MHGAAGAESAIIFGDGFRFSIHVPPGWVCNCDGKTAAEIGANALLYKKGQNWKTTDALIFLRVNESPNAKVDEDIKADMGNYKNNYPDAEYKSLMIAHLKYKTAAKLFLRPKRSAEYVTYVAPQPFPGKSISSAMNVQKREARADELNAYRDVTSSIIWLGPQM